jgi:hypothetical protein
MLKTLKTREMIKDKNGHYFTFGERRFSGGFRGRNLMREEFAFELR